jgi:hypothetical protein
MSTKFKLNHEHYVAISKDMIRITDAILKHVVSKTEQAAMEIGDKIQSLCHLSEGQAATVKNLIMSIYDESSSEYAEVEQLAHEANHMANQIFESAASGDLETAHSIGDSDHYRHIHHKTGALAKQLEKISQSDKELAHMIAPVIMALQFQDNVRQSLENLIRCFEQVNHEAENMTEAKLPPAYAGTFWTKLENFFTSTAERNMVRKVIYGENAKLIMDAEKDDPFMF